jgi:hypothetical protein
MVVGDFDVERTSPIFRPLEAYPPLLIDAYAELSLPVAAQSFKPIARQSHQVVSAYSSLDNIQSPLCLLLKCLKLSYPLAVGETLCALVAVLGQNVSQSQVFHTQISQLLTHRVKAGSSSLTIFRAELTEAHT